MDLELNTFDEINVDYLNSINGGFSKNDALGIAGSACYVGGVIVGCVASGGAGLVLIGTGFVAWDAMN